MKTLFLIPAGFEPATVRLEGECSIQLSYGTDNSFIVHQRTLDVKLRKMKKSVDKEF